MKITVICLNYIGLLLKGVFTQSKARVSGIGKCQAKIGQIVF